MSKITIFVPLLLYRAKRSLSPEPVEGSKGPHQNNLEILKSTTIKQFNK